MNYLHVSSVDQYEGELMGYNVIGNKIFYLTEKELCVVKISGKFKKQSIRIKGSTIINFVISKRGYIAFLYKNKTLEVRRLDQLGQVCHKFSNIILMPQQNYPKMKWDYEQLYLVYPDSMEIFSMKDKSRKGYTDIVMDYQNEVIMDMIISNIMDSEKAAILQLRNRLVFTIIPIPISELQIQNINCAINLYSPSHLNDSRRQFLAVLNKNCFLKIYNLLNLKLIAQIQIQTKPHQFLEIESDANCECILVRFINSQTIDISRNIIYKINSEDYYSQCTDYFAQQRPFFKYCFEVSIHQNLTLFPMIVENIDNHIFDSYHITFLKKGQLYIAQQLIPHNYSQTSSQLKIKMGNKEWTQSSEWKDIISTYLQLSIKNFTKEQQKLNFSQQDRQVYEYNIIKEEFDNIIAKFTAKIAEQSRKNPLSEKNIHEEWSIYMAGIAKERNFMLETMKLFKIQPQIIRQNTQTRIANNDLEDCVNEISNRESRIDAKIQQKRKEIQQKQQKQQKNKMSNMQIQEQYQKFVAEFLAETERKQRQQQEQALAKSQKKVCLYNEQVTLQLPKLNQQEKMFINSQLLNQLGNSQNLSPVNVQSKSEVKYDQAWNQLQQVFSEVQKGISPIQTSLQTLIGRISDMEVNLLEGIKRNEEKIEKQSSINLEQIVKGCCKKMLENVNTKIKKGIDSTTQRISKLEDKNIRYYEELIHRYKDYIKHHIQYRIGIFYKSRKQLETSLSNMVKERVAKSQRVQIQ